MPESQIPIPRIARMRELREICGGVSARTIERWIQFHGFPRPLKLTARCNAWRLSEVAAWLDSRKAA